MNRTLSLLLLASLPLCIPAYALDAHGSEMAAGRGTIVESFLRDLRTDNSVYMDSHRIEFYSALAKGQSPVATVITCADSRVQANMFDRAPEGQLFTIRNIGNQLGTAEGSVEYGVHHLHTPVLLFIGHSRCGAIAAVSGNYSKESEAIRRELDTIAIPREVNNIDGVKINVHNQVEAAMLKFAEEIEAGQLTVIGAVMDFADDLHRGSGKLHIIDINGESDPARLDNVSALLASPKPGRSEAARRSSHPRPAH
ncbi:MAG: carbonic anhydrase [Pseudomonadota bacterium]